MIALLESGLQNPLRRGRRSDAPDRGSLVSIASNRGTALLHGAAVPRHVTPGIRTIEFTPEDANGEITPEWLAGVAEGLQEERDELPPGAEITRVEITVELPE